MTSDGMTKMGYTQIIQYVEDLEISPPQNKNLRDLEQWMAGYMECHKKITDALKKLRDQYGR